MAARVALAVIGLWLAAAPAVAAPVVAALSNAQISIDSGFTGTDVLLYGAIDGKGDVVVVVRGPSERVVVRRKERVAGVWVNSDAVEFVNVPAYYSVVSSRPLAAIASQGFRTLNQIGLEALRLRADGEVAADDLATFREALIRNRQREALYSAREGGIAFLGNQLFSTPLHFPANVPEGDYRAEYFLIRDGELVSAGATPLFVDKTGFQWQVNHYAHAQPALYGIVAILIALAAGWTAAAVFRKV